MGSLRPECCIATDGCKLVAFSMDPSTPITFLPLWYSRSHESSTHCQRSKMLHAYLAQKGEDMAVIRDLLGYHRVTLTEKYKRIWRRAICAQLQKLDATTTTFTKNSLSQLLSKRICTIFAHQKKCLKLLVART